MFPVDNETLADHKHIEAYSADLRDTHASGVGVKETSDYPYLSNLLKNYALIKANCHSWSAAPVSAKEGV